MSHPPISIRFSQGRFAELCLRLLDNLDYETFALLLAKREDVGKQVLIKVIDVRYLNASDYERRSSAHLRPKRETIHQVLSELQRRLDVDTLIDVHTHPFCRNGAAFSGVDDRDEIGFCRWLANTFDDVHYGSIVMSQTDYSARFWWVQDSTPIAKTAFIKTQTLSERWPSADSPPVSEDVLLEATDPNRGFLARSVLALGLDTLRKLMDRQSIAIIGVGGLGSIIAENLIHMGFLNMHLVDPDRVEFTNLNRIVGAYHDDAEQQRFKVDVVQQHLQRINPNACVTTHPLGVEDDSLLPILADVDWIIAATDNQLSRFKVQQVGIRYFVPIISSGVNISVENGQITDMSGEVVVARTGDRVCLHCLGRINPTRVAAEEQAGHFIGNELVKRGYVHGQEVKEPAVKTLNAIVGAMAVEVLLNQYTERQPHAPIHVYENNRAMAMYEDTLSVEARNKHCFVCGIFEN